VNGYPPFLPCVQSPVLPARTCRVLYSRRTAFPEPTNVCSHPSASSCPFPAQFPIALMASTCSRVQNQRPPGDFDTGTKPRRVHRRIVVELTPISLKTGVFARVVFGDFSGGGLLLDTVDENRPLDDLGQQQRTVQPDFPHIWGDFPRDVSYAARTYVIYFVLHANSLDKGSQCTRRPKSLLGNKLEIRR
jgi:hypothetical protein